MKRYNIGTKSGEAHEREHPEGEYVLFDDVSAELTTLRQRLAEAEADIARWEGAARVLADELHVRRRGDPMGVLPDVRNQTDANPTASALVREGGGGTC